MNMNIGRKLPIGIQTFEKIREGDYIYVDKTELVWKMAATRYPLLPQPSPTFWQKLVALYFRSLL